MGLPPLEPKSSASADSATSAIGPELQDTSRLRVCGSGHLGRQDRSPAPHNERPFVTARAGLGRHHITFWSASIADKVQARVSITLGGQQVVFGIEVLQEDWNAKTNPEMLAVRIGERFRSLPRHDHYASAHSGEPAVRDVKQVLQGSGKHFRVGDRI